MSDALSRSVQTTPRPPSLHLISKAKEKGKLSVKRVNDVGGSGGNQRWVSWLQESVDEDYVLL